MKRTGIWFLIALGLFAATIFGFLVFSPTARLVANILLAPLLYNSRPPPIAQGQITDEDWLHWQAGSKKLTAVLERKFPTGSSEAGLRSTLLGRGFHAVAPPPPNCLPPGQRPQVGVMYYNCLTPEQEEQRQKTLEYKWGGGVCTEFINVRWSSDDAGAITRVEGSYHGACL